MPGTTLVNGKYTILGKVGAGNNSNVYAVSAIKGQKQVIRAIKVVRITLLSKATL